MTVAARARIERGVVARLREAPDGRPRREQLPAALRETLVDQRLVIPAGELRLLERWLEDRLFGLGRSRAAPARRPRHRGHGQRHARRLGRARRAARGNFYSLFRSGGDPRADRATRCAARPTDRSREPTRGRPPSGRFSRSRCHPTDFARRSSSHDPPLRAARAEPRGSCQERDVAAGRDGVSRAHRSRAEEPARFGRHVEWQDHDTECARLRGRRSRADRHDRRCRRAPSSAAQRGGSRDHARQVSKDRVRSTCERFCEPRFGCAPIASSSARCAEARLSTCCRR